MRSCVTIFSVILGALSMSTACPSGCQCFEASVTVKCVSLDLQTVPGGIPGYTNHFVITGNLIPRIGYESFQGLDNVTNLILSNNGITEIASHTFSSLTMLRSLDLNGNQLALIHPEAFMVPGSPLEELNLSNSLFNHTALTDLITALRWGGLGSLRRLDLSANGLLLLPPGMFSPLPNLRQLRLDNNSLVAIYNGTFSGVELLEDLDLTGNRFTAFSAEGLREMERLDRARLRLGYNPYLCACGTEEFANWLNNSKVRVGDLEKLRCASPGQLRHVAVQVLSAKVLHCNQRGQMMMEEVDGLSLQTSYVLLGLVCGFVGMVFCFVVFLNRKDIEKWIVELRDGCQDMMEGYQYRYEIDSDPRIRQIGANGKLEKTNKVEAGRQIPTKTSLSQIPADITV
ncbi:trophoblast glycoprotein-like [Sardina pilchardus]|uniref:trophoblast glycoprotein-like n=1 Tax=Sardina pilchardus TaxID=27697 RepID=UPI002E0F33C7